MAVLLEISQPQHLIPQCLRPMKYHLRAIENRIPDSMKSGQRCAILIMIPSSESKKKFKCSQKRLLSYFVEFLFFDGFLLVPPINREPSLRGRIEEESVWLEDKTHLRSLH
ncbi:hypothetical protein RR46_14600 [Papilio xuthus]|uniref:Uncharacterized protein n=1 Tax=Papilio xuthus TaxID=66420 RepID=A0A194PCS2_PAPXU|nr:hypothetical protein RR46_14600 [Papilio xuthus]